MLEVEKECVLLSPDDALVLDVEDPVADLVVVVFPPIVVEELTLPPPAVTVVELLPSDELLLSMIVQVAPSFSFIVSAATSPQKNRVNGAINIFAFMSYLQEGAGRRRSRLSLSPQHEPLFFLALPGGHFLLEVSSCAAPAALPAVPTELPVLPSPTDVPPVPSVEAAPEPSPEPAAEPAVPTELLALPSPTDVPPVPSVEAAPDPSPEPAADPAVPTELLAFPSPTEVPPVPSVDAEPLQSVLPAGHSVPPAEEPAVPTVLFAAPSPTLVPPVPTVLLDCVYPSIVEVARSAAANAKVVRCFISISLVFLNASTCNLIVGAEDQT
jgi:hypothetical protein